MDVGLGWLGVGVGAVGFVLAYLMASASAQGERPVSGEECRRAWLSAGAALVLTLIFWAISMRSDPPFSPGQTLGWGFLIGGAAGALMCLVSHRFDVFAAAGPLRTRYLAIHSTAFLALLGVSLTYSIFRGDPSDALMGFAIGAAMGAILRFYVQGLRSTSDDLTMQAWAIFAVTLAASMVLAVEHFDISTLRLWWPLPILMAVTVTVAGLIGTGIGSVRGLDARPGASVALSCLIASILAIALSVVYAWRLVEDWRLLEVVAAGIGCAALAAWLVASMLQKRGGAWGLDAASACVLLVVAFAVVAFKLWSGLGIGIGIVAAWAVALPALALRGDENDDSLARAISTVLFVWLSILLYRLFMEIYRPEMGADLRVHYTFVGALIGAILPFVFASSIHRLRDCARAREGVRGDLCALAGAASLGLFAAASPKVLYLVWELKALLGFMFGLVASGAFLLMTQLFQSGAPGERRGPSLADYSPGLLVIGAQLVAIQFTGLFAALETTRAMQIGTLAAAVVIAVAWFLVVGISSQRRAR